MSARVLNFRDYEPDRPEDSGVAPAPARDELDSTRLQHWVGSSGKRYIHTVHTLLGCPELPAVNYLLVRRSNDGGQTVLAAGHAKSAAESLNLAEIRRLGATLGANEVHVHMLAQSTDEAKVIEQDLRAGQIQLDAETVSTARH